LHNRNIPPQNDVKLKIKPVTHDRAGIIIRLCPVALASSLHASVLAAPVFLLISDLRIHRILSTQFLGGEIAAISPDYAAYSSLFVGAGFDGMLLCDADDAELQQLVEGLGINNFIHRRRVVAQLRAVRSRYDMQPQNS
jgi:hypothetical protein